MVSKGATTVVLWPHYFDVRLSRAQGRRVGEDKAVNGPDSQWIEATCKHLGLSCELDEGARHPSIPYQKAGRVLVHKDGTKEALLDRVATQMRERQETPR